MNPHYKDTCEFDTLSIAPLQQKKKRKKKYKGSYGITVGPDILRLVCQLGLDKARLGGEDSLTNYF